MSLAILNLLKIELIPGIVPASPIGIQLLCDAVHRIVAVGDRVTLGIRASTDPTKTIVGETRLGRSVRINYSQQVSKWVVLVGGNAPQNILYCGGFIVVGWPALL